MRSFWFQSFSNIPNIQYEKIVLIGVLGMVGGDRNLFVRKGVASQKKIEKHWFKQIKSVFDICMLQTLHISSNLMKSNFAIFVFLQDTSYSRFNTTFMTNFFIRFQSRRKASVQWTQRPTDSKSFDLSVTSYNMIGWWSRWDQFQDQKPDVNFGY